ARGSSTAQRRGQSALSARQSTGSGRVAGGLEPDECPGERGRRPRVVDRVLRAASGKAALRPFLRSLGARAVDLLGPLGAVSEEDDLAVADLGEATRYGEVVLFAADAIHDLADSEGPEGPTIGPQDAEPHGDP